MFERFRPEARHVVSEAQTQARRLGHGHIGTEHLLLALVSVESSAADLLRSRGLSVDVVEKDVASVLGLPSAERDRAALAMLGIDIDDVRAAAESTFGHGALNRAGAPRHRRRRLRRRHGCRHARVVTSDRIPFSPRAKKCLELSLREALRLRHDFISAEHIALGIVREGNGLACAVMAGRTGSLPGLRATLEAAVRSAA